MPTSVVAEDFELTEVVSRAQQNEENSSNHQVAPPLNADTTAGKILRAVGASENLGD